MLEYILTFLGIVVTVVVAYYGYQQQKKVIRQQADEIQELKEGRRRELIEKYYPPLVENLRLSLPEIAYRYLQGYQEQGNYFDVLIDMANDSTLKLIQGLDEELHDNESYFRSFFPTEEEIDIKKDESWEEIPHKWQFWIEDKYYELPRWRENKTPVTLASSFSNTMLWVIWRKDEQLFTQNFDREIIDHFAYDCDDIKESEIIE